MLLSSFMSNAQITISNIENYPEIKGDYQKADNYPVNPWTRNKKDPGTNSYFYEDNETKHGFWIVRINNYWHVEEFLSGAIALRFKSKKESFDIDPKCGIEWEVWNMVWYDYGNRPYYSGKEANKMCISIN
jgi:hypothetical protein